MKSYKRGQEWLLFNDSYISRQDTGRTLWPTEDTFVKKKTSTNRRTYKRKAGWQGRCGVNHWECWAMYIPRSQMILTDQSWHTVELWVIWALSLPRFHSAWLQMEDVLLKWENDTETAINSVLLYLSPKFPVGRRKQRVCSRETDAAWCGRKY